MVEHGKWMEMVEERSPKPSDSLKGWRLVSVEVC